MRAHLEFTSEPSAALFMLRAFVPSPGLSAGAGRVSARWRKCKVDPRKLASFCDLTGQRAEDGTPFLYPHVFGFRLVMAVLTHPRFPLPIWNALQIRNRLAQRRAIPVDAEMELEAAMGETRIVRRGAEIDVVSVVRVEGEPFWESVNTFYYRGRYGEAQAPAPNASTPKFERTPLATWRTHVGVGRRFAALTGDYNGVHLSDAYARWFGFPRAFHHPQLMLGQCLARLPRPAGPSQRLDAWIKGTVPYGVDVRLEVDAGAEEKAFALFVEGEPRPALVGVWADQPG